MFNYEKWVKQLNKCCSAGDGLLRWTPLVSTGCAGVVDSSPHVRIICETEETEGTEVVVNKAFAAAWATELFTWYALCSFTLLCAKLTCPDAREALFLLRRLLHHNHGRRGVHGHWLDHLNLGLHHLHLRLHHLHLRLHLHRLHLHLHFVIF